MVNNRGKHVFSLMAQAGNLRLESDRYRDVYGATGQWQYNIDARNQVSAYVQYSDLAYIGQSVRDADRWVIGSGYAHALRDGTLLFGSLYLVQEQNQGKSSPGFDTNQLSLMAGVSVLVARPIWTLKPFFSQMLVMNIEVMTQRIQISRSYAETNR